MLRNKEHIVWILAALLIGFLIVRCEPAQAQTPGQPALAADACYSAGASQEIANAWNAAYGHDNPQLAAAARFWNLVEAGECVDFPGEDREIVWLREKAADTFLKGVGHMEIWQAERADGELVYIVVGVAGERS